MTSQSRLAGEQTTRSITRQSPPIHSLPPLYSPSLAALSFLNGKIVSNRTNIIGRRVGSICQSSKTRSPDKTHTNRTSPNSMRVVTCTWLGSRVVPRLRESRLLAASGRGGEFTQHRDHSFARLCTKQVAKLRTIRNNNRETEAIRQNTREGETGERAERCCRVNSSPACLPSLSVSLSHSNLLPFDHCLLR